MDDDKSPNGEWISGKSITFSREKVKAVCQLFEDENGIHSKLGIPPFAFPLGVMSGRAFRFAQEQGWLKNIALVIEYSCRGELGDKAIRPEIAYPTFFRFETGIKKVAQVYFRIDSVDVPGSTLFSGAITVKYR